MFEFLGRYLLLAMTWINSNWINNIAISVFLFTAIIKLLALPADLNQRQSTAKMAALNPELQKLQKRYESNPEVLQRKTQELYKKKRVSPYASCLPLLVTMFIFMIFLRAMNYWSYIGYIDIYDRAKTQQTIAAETGEPLVVEINGENDMIADYRWAWVYNIWMPDSFLESAEPVPTYKQFSTIPVDKMNLYFDEETLQGLSEVTEDEYNKVMVPYSEAYSGVRNGWGIMPILAAGSMLLIQLIQQKVNPQPAAAQGQPGTGKSMMIFMAIFSGVICFQQNTAFSLYWLASNVFSLLVTLLLGRYTKKKQAEAELDAGNIIA